LSQPASPAADVHTVLGSASRDRVFHTLDALRGIAAIGVVIFHMKRFFSPIAVPGGYLAVDLFFIMSGVVLANAYENRFRAGMGTREFMRIRLIRLYPLYFLGTMLGILVTFASLFGNNTENWNSHSLTVAAFLALLFLPYFSGTDDRLFPLNIPCWSLFFEIVINFLFALTWPALTTRRLVAICLATGCALVFATAHNGNIDLGSVAANFLPGLIRTSFGFSIGILIARQIRGARRRNSNLGFLAIATVVIVAISGSPFGKYRALWDAASVLLVFPLVVYWSTLIDPSSWLRTAATFLGVTSYAVYVLHKPLLAILNSAIQHHVFGANDPVGTPYLGATILAALLTGCWLVDRYFDSPVRRHLTGILRRQAKMTS
jgi:peptidoglycan/LPS O-acetylase OafA/YrhL